MKVILQEDVVDLGQAGDLVEVKAGYARNYLIPKGLAMMATSRNVKVLEHQRRLTVARQGKQHTRATDLADAINTLSATFTRKAGDDDRLFGSVTSQHIAEFFSDEKLPVERKQIRLEEPIKALGVFNVPIKLHQEVTAELKVWVVKE
ncbi:MAG: 50S ribosomal protein L9 [bacterium]